MGEQRTAFILLLILCFAVISISEIGIIKAEPMTVAVPDDYSTIVDAIGNASEGDTVFVRSVRTYNETIIIDKSLSLIGEDGETELIGWGHIPGPYLHSIIQIEVDDVKISGFSLYYDHYGITGSGDRVQIVGNKMDGIGINLGGSYNNISENNIRNSGISFYGSFNTVTGNNLTRGNIQLTGSSNIVSGNNITDGGIGIKVMGDFNTIYNNIITDGSVGIELEMGSSNNVCGNFITENWFMGIHLSTTFDNVVYENYISDNVYEHDGYGISLSGRGYHAENNTFYRNTFMNNSNHIRIEAPYYVNYWDNGEEGNYWDNYTGVDNDGDGIGDIPYILTENNLDNYPLVEPHIIPEFPSWTLLITLVSFLVVAVVFRQKLSKRREKR